MRATILLCWVGTLLAAGCGRNLAPPPADAAAAAPTRWEVTPDLQVVVLAPGVWQHVSWQRLADGTRFPSNGLLVRDGDGLLLIDTAWGEQLTRDLLDWVDATLRLPVRRAVATHFHDDRLGGAPALLARQVRMVAHPLTRELAAAGDLPLPDTLGTLRAVGGAARVGPVERFHPGPAHTRDNLVVWLPQQRILFGGCAVRATAATTRGNVADADTVSWPAAIARAEARYPDARLVIPGHGDAGGRELLSHTRSLFGR